MKKIEKEIYDLIFYYMYKNKCVDRAYLEGLIEIMRSSNGTEKQIQKVTYEETDSLASYRPGVININLARIFEIAKTISNEFELSPFEASLNYFFTPAHAVLHEGEHAIQDKMVTENRDDIEAIIVRESRIIDKIKSRPGFFGNLFYDLDINRLEELKKSLRDTAIQQQMLYKEFYSLAPKEHLAEIRSNTACYSILHSFGQSSLRLTDYFLYSVYANLLRGYDIDSEPTRYYLCKVNPFCDFSLIEDKSSSLSENEKALYGLKISDACYLAIDESMQKVKERLY